MYGDVILTRDVTEHGLRASDSTTWIRVPLPPWSGFSSAGHRRRVHGEFDNAKGTP